MYSSNSNIKKPNDKLTSEIHRVKSLKRILSDPDDYDTIYQTGNDAFAYPSGQKGVTDYFRNLYAQWQNREQRSGQFRKSSNVDKATYRANDQLLTVYYKNGMAYEYENVTQEMWQSLKKAKSKGQWVWGNLRPNPVAYPYTRVK